MKRGRLIAARVVDSKKLRFGLVGAVNTGVDFAILFLLARVFGLPLVAANMISTSFAMVVSYILNKNAVFKNSDKQGLAVFAAFVTVTLIGLWGIQSVVITLVANLLAGFWSADVVLFAAKILATVASLVWNYIWYSRVIFKKS